MARDLLLKNADLVVTMDEERAELKSAWIHIQDGMIAALGTGPSPACSMDETVDLSGRLVTPGLINTHHHMFQSLTRAVAAAQSSSLFGWLQALYPIWSRLTPEMIRTSTLTAMAELLLSGCTTSSDHLYLFPNGARLDDCIEAAGEIGMRFHAARGAMSIGESQGGLPPDGLVEHEAAILKDTQRVIETFHDPSPGAMVRVVVAPCSPFSVSQGLMADSARLARHYGVSMHTHLAEDTDDVAYSQERFGLSPARYAEELGWLGPDVWHAHCVQLDREGIRLFAGTGTGVAHCPCSNMRLGSGIAPIGRMRRAGVPVGLGVDGSASNDGGGLVAEMRQALLLQRVKHGAGAMTPRQALEIATLGGAKVLNRADIGALVPGAAADLAVFDRGRLEFAGAGDDPVAALALCAPVPALHTLVAGRFVVRDGQLTTVDLGGLVRRHNELSRALLSG